MKNKREMKTKCACTCKSQFHAQYLHKSRFFVSVNENGVWLDRN
jgi:hypothetical protein